MRPFAPELVSQVRPLPGTEGGSGCFTVNVFTEERRYHSECCIVISACLPQLRTVCLQLIVAKMWVIVHVH